MCTSSDQRNPAKRYKPVENLVPLSPSWLAGRGPVAGVLIKKMLHWLLLTETTWRSIRKKEFSGKIINTRLPKTSGFSWEHAPLMTAGVDFTRLTVMTSKIYYSFYNKTMSSKEWCSDSIYLSGFSFFGFLGHINILLYFKNSHSCLLNLE